jgi:hypothetical protein
MKRPKRHKKQNTESRRGNKLPNPWREDDDILRRSSNVEMITNLCLWASRTINATLHSYLQ